MSYAQIITPNPNIACTPGYCLQYVRQTFGLAGVHPSATAGWNASPTQHPDLNFPAGCWVPVWFGMAAEPLGHVVLMAPDGSVYSTSDYSTTPHHHASLADLLNYYAYYGLPLTYRGWTEDIEDVAVIAANSTINFESATITPATTTEEIDVSAEENILARLTEIVQWQADQFSGIRDAGALKQAADLTIATQARMSQILEAVDVRTGDSGSGTLKQAADAILRSNVENMPAAVLNQQFTLPDGTVTNLAGILAAINAKPVGVSNAQASVDVDALVARLKAELPAAVLAELTNKLTK